MVNRFQIALVVGCFLAGAGITVPILESRGVFEPNPYRVLPWLTEWEREKDKIWLRVTFIKGDDTFPNVKCSWNASVVVGYYFGVPVAGSIPWKPSNGRDAGDLIEGQVTVEIEIGPLDRDYEALEFRTRHICREQGQSHPKTWVVDRVFKRIELHAKN